MKSDKLKLMCLSAVMAALYFGLDLLAETTSAVFAGSMKISFSGLPVVIVAIVGGPLWGAATGFIGELAVQGYYYGFGITTLLWVIPAAARGLLMGWLFRAFKKSTRPLILTVETVLSSIAVTLLNTVGILIDQTIYGYSSYIATVIKIPLRIATGAITAVLFSLLLPMVLRPLKKYIK